MIVIAIKRFTLNGRVVDKGQEITTSSSSGLIDGGLARTMTAGETRAMLDEYLAEAKRLFSWRRHSTLPNKRGCSRWKRQDHHREPRT